MRVKSLVLVAIARPDDGRLRVGQRVYFEGNGEGARVVLQKIRYQARLRFTLPAIETSGVPEP